MSERNASPEQIEQEISATRADIGDTLDAIQDKLSPGQLLDQALGMVKDGGGEFASNFGRTLRDNPVPVALLGVGVAWLAMSGGRGKDTSASRPDTDASTDSHTYTSRTGTGVSTGSHTYAGTGAAAVPAREGLDHESTRGDSRTMAQRAKDKLGEVADKAGDKLSQAKDSVSDAADDVRARGQELGSEIGSRYEDARDNADRLSNRARRSAVEAKRSVKGFVDENPLVVGAAALAAGAVLGSLLPPTAREDKLVGSMSDDAKRAGVEAASKVASKAEDVAKAGLEAGKKEAKSQDLTPEAAGAQVARVADAGAKVVKAATKAAKSKAHEAVDSAPKKEDATPGSAGRTPDETRPRPVKKPS